MTSYTCPSSAPAESDIIGCGAIFEAEPDGEGLVDCPECGMWFNPEFEKEKTLTPDCT